MQDAVKTTLAALSQSSILDSQVNKLVRELHDCLKYNMVSDAINLLDCYNPDVRVYAVARVFSEFTIPDNVVNRFMRSMLNKARGKLVW